MYCWVVHFVDSSVVPRHSSTLGTNEWDGASVYIHVLAMGVANIHEVDVVTSDAAEYSRHWTSKGIIALPRRAGLWLSG